jgi:hypothetical protein
MMSFRLPASTIIKLATIYFFLISIPSLLLCLQDILAFLRFGDTSKFIFILGLMLGVTLNLGNAIGLSRRRFWSWRLTILSGIMTVFVILLLLLTGNGLKGVSAFSVLEYLINVVLLFVFWKNSEVKAALSMFRPSIALIDNNIAKT